MKTLRVYTDCVNVGDRYRKHIDEQKVSALAESMKAIGLLQPISVWIKPDENGVNEAYLIAGLHRLRAAQKLGWEQVDAIELDLNDLDRRRWEIAENLHRAELTALERDEHVAEWIRLTEEAKKKEQENQASDLVQIAPKRKAGRQSGGVRAAARELGIESTDAKRAVKVASLTEEAKEAARETGLDKKRSALLKAAKAQEEGKDASQVLRDIATDKKCSTAPSDDGPQWEAEDEDSYASLLDTVERWGTSAALEIIEAWDSTTKAAKAQFLREHRNAA